MANLSGTTRNWPGYLYVMPAFAWIALFFMAPLICMGAYSFFYVDYEGFLIKELSLVNYMELFSSKATTAALINSVNLTLTVVVISLLMSYPLAMIILYKVPPKRQRLVLALAILPFWTLYVVRSYAWLLTLSPTGVINQSLLAVGLIDKPLELAFNNGATVVGYVHFFIMLNTLTIYANLAQINPRYLLAARDLGASRLRAFCQVLLPLSLPGIAVGTFLTVVLCIGDFITPQILGGNKDLLLPQAIMLQIQTDANYPMASAMSLVMTLVVCAAYLMLSRWMKMSKI